MAKKLHCTYKIVVDKSIYEFCCNTIFAVRNTKILLTFTNQLGAYLGKL